MGPIALGDGIPENTTTLLLALSLPELSCIGVLLFSTCCCCCCFSMLSPLSGTVPLLLPPNQVAVHWS